MGGQSLMNFTLLVELLKENLSEYRYTEYDEGINNSIHFVAIIKTPRRWLVRYLCAIVEIPDNITNPSLFKQFLSQVRKSLTSKYAKFPWYKELGTFLVFFCEDGLYKKLTGIEGDFKDRTGFHMNVILGTCFINEGTFETSTDSTWGLWYSGKHYRAIRAAVTQWCEVQKKELEVTHQLT